MSDERNVARLRASLASGQVAYGTFCTLKDPAVVEMLGWAGYDFVVIDTEHALTDLRTVGELVRAAELSGLTAFVRIPYRDMNTALRLVEHGVSGILAPHVTTREHVDELVATCRYRPAGDRGVDPGTRAAHYGLDDFADHAARTNRDVLTMILVEDRAGVDALDDILAGGGVDVAMLGPSDLARSYGVSGELGHPLVRDAIERSTAVLRQHGVAILRAAYDHATVEEAVASGAQLVTSPAIDAHFVANALRDHLREVKR